MLAAVSWLVELLSYDDVVSRDTGNNESMMSESDRSKSRFYQFLCDSYPAFMYGDDAAWDEQVAAMTDYFTQRNKAIADSVAAEHDRNTLLNEELKSLQESESIIPGLREAVVTLASDKAKHQAFVDHMDVRRTQEATFGRRAGWVQDGCRMGAGWVAKRVCCC
jgi:SMC interacting uncharacterized protein involved in chromosome segregation